MVARHRAFALLLFPLLSVTTSRPHRRPVAPSPGKGYVLPCPSSQSVSVTPDGGFASWSQNTTGHADTFTVQNTGSCTDGYNFSYTTTGPISGVTLNKASAGLGPGGSTTVVATYNVGAAGTGVLTVRAAGTAPGSNGYASDNGYYNVTVTAPPTPAVSVTPDGATSATRAASAGPYHDTFTVTNTGNVQTTYTLTCGGSGNVTCTRINLTSVSLAAGAAATDTAYYNVGAAGTGRLTLTAAGSGVSDSGFYNVPIVRYGVTVTPKGATAASRLANTNGYAETFTLTNTGSATNIYTVTCVGSSNVTCTGVTAATYTLNAGASVVDTARYNVGSVGTGTLTLTVTGTNATDAGSYSVPVVAASAQPPAVDVASVNPGPMRKRDLCLTIAMGAAAAAECGDLRIVHALPTTRTMNKARTPTLLYNNHVAHPYVLIAVNVTLPGTALIPDSVTGAVTINSQPRARGTWSGSEWSQGQTRRVVLGFDAVTDSTGIYSYTLEVRNWYGTANQPTTTTGQLAVVNRSSSPFGAGWWLAGLEQLNVGTMVWVGGDGSIRQYQLVPGKTNVWTAPAMDHPDTLKKDSTGIYIRYDRDSVRVKFDTAGLHIATINRQGHTTTFAYVIGSRRLASITLPPASANKVYQFNYDANARLQFVTAPGPNGPARTTNVTVTNGLLMSIQDPDLTTVSFAYDPGFANRMTQRTDRRGTVTTFGYDVGSKIATATLNMGTGQPSLVTTVLALESRGLAGSGTPSSVDTAVAYARLDGPRTDASDTTLFWLDRFEALRKIVDARDDVTVISRGDSHWPALVTRVQYPTGQVMAAAYDTLRGNVLTVTDSSSVNGNQYATTTYQWDPKWDAVRKIARPEGDSTIFAYDPATGNRQWQEDGRGAVSQVTFGYNSANQVISVTQPSNPPLRIGYDAVGNMDSVTTPLLYLTLYQNDGAGRTTVVRSPIDATHRKTDSTAYDLADHDTLVVSVGPQMSSTVLAETVFVRKHVNPNGQTDTLSRWGRPDVAGIGTITTKWSYDRAGRVIAEIAPDNVPDSMFYDAAGNDTLTVTRRGLRIRMAYDVLNRLATRILPPVSDSLRHSGITASFGYPETYPAYQVPADVQTFTYDPMGRILTANNADARVSRGYYTNGLLRADTLWVRTVQDTVFAQHRYITQYAYDLDGRRTGLTVPSDLEAHGLVSSSTYQYDPQFGALTSLSQSSDAFGFGYTGRGDVSSITFPGSFTEKFSYDPDDRIVTDTIRNSGGTTYPRFLGDPIRAITYGYDARGNVVSGADPLAFQDTVSMAYSGLGHVVQSNLTQHENRWCGPGSRYVVAESFQYDPLGNRGHSTRTESSQAGSTCFSSELGGSGAAYAPPAGIGRLVRDTVTTGGTRAYTYNAAGDVEFSQHLGTPSDEQASHYAADGKLRATDTRAAQSSNTKRWWTRAFDEYRYDALGRRIWVRSRKSCLDDGTMSIVAATECQTSIVRRVIWDQDQVLAEIQMPGDSTSRDMPYWENDTAAVILAAIAINGFYGDPSRYFGRVVYAHAFGVDHPVSVTRYNYVYAVAQDSNLVSPAVVIPSARIMPFWNALGDPALGAFDNGAQAYCQPATSTLDCLVPFWPYRFSAYDREHGVTADNWNGSLLEHGKDKSGLEFKRNRYYDPGTGRFTQEDPLGLAGGLNLYGFAGGDPINFSDPFGLCPPKDDVPCRDVTSEEGRKILHAAAETGQWTWTEGKTEEGQIPKDVPNHVGDCTDFCETAQENAGLAALDPRPSTRDFAGSSDFRSLGGDEKPQMGDIVVYKGHAGVATGIVDKQGRPMALQNGKSGTTVIPFDRAAKIYRRQVPDLQ